MNIIAIAPGKFNSMVCFYISNTQTKIVKLIELGVIRRLAVLHGLNRKSYWLADVPHTGDAYCDAQSMV